MVEKNTGMDAFPHALGSVQGRKGNKSCLYAWERMPYKKNIIVCNKEGFLRLIRRNGVRVLSSLQTRNI